jgi:hypothetical protein
MENKMNARIAGQMGEKTNFKGRRTKNKKRTYPWKPGKARSRVERGYIHVTLNQRFVIECRRRPAAIEPIWSPHRHYMDRIETEPGDRTEDKKERLRAYNKARRRVKHVTCGE